MRWHLLQKDFGNKIGNWWNAFTPIILGEELGLSWGSLVERLGDVGTLQCLPECKVSWSAEFVGFLCLQLGLGVMESTLWAKGLGGGKEEPLLMETLSLFLFLLGNCLPQATPCGVGLGVRFLRSLGIGKSDKSVQPSSWVLSSPSAQSAP